MNPKGNPQNLKPWKKGQSGNPAGRPKGSRDALTEDVISAIKAEWAKRGASVLQGLSPVDLAKLAAAVISKESKVDVEHSGVVTHEHQSVSETAAFLAEALGPGTGKPLPKPLSH